MPHIISVDGKINTSCIIGNPLDPLSTSPWLTAPQSSPRHMSLYPSLSGLWSVRSQSFSPFPFVLSCPALSCHLTCPVTCPVLSPVLSCPCPVTCSYISCTAPMKYSIKFKLFSSRTTLVLLLGPILVPSRWSPFHCIFFLELKS
jgi:hypothetical protein